MANIVINPFTGKPDLTGSGVPDGGTTGQILSKQSNANGDTVWVTPSAASVADGSITTAKLADNAITTVKILDENVNANKLASNAVTTVKINDSAVIDVKIASNAVTTTKIADANVTTAKIADSNVTEAKINNAAVTTNKIADGAVQTAKVADGAITTTKINDGAVSSAKVAVGAITTTLINDNAVSNAKLAQVATKTYKGRTTAGTGNVEDLTVAQMQVDLGINPKPELQANLTVWAGKFDKNYKIYSEVTGVLPTISNTNAVVGNTLEIYNYNSSSFPLLGQEGKVVVQTGEFDSTKTHRIVVEYLDVDEVALIIGQNLPTFIAPTFGVNPSFVNTTAYEGESIAITPGTGGTAVGSEYEWQGLSQSDVWETISGATTSSYTPPRSANVSTGFKNVRCIVYPLDSQNRRGSGVTLTITTFYKVEDVNRVTGIFGSTTNFASRSNGSLSVGIDDSILGTVTSASTQYWVNSSVSPSFVNGETYRLFFNLRGIINGATTGLTFGYKPGGTATFPSATLSGVNSTTYTRFVVNKVANVTTGGNTFEVNSNSQAVIIGDFIELNQLEAYKVLNP